MQITLIFFYSNLIKISVSFPRYIFNKTGSNLVNAGLL